MFKHALVSFFALSSIAVLSAACEDDTTAKPQVIFEGGTRESGGKCLDGGSSRFEVGDFGNPDAKPPVASQVVVTGGASGQGNAEIDCSVTPAGADAFNVNATVVLSGPFGGLFTITGQFKTTGEQTAKVRLNGKTNSYSDQDSCVVTYTQEQMGVAAGRVWGIVKCTNGVSTNNPDRVCGLEAQFRFENCIQ